MMHNKGLQEDDIQKLHTTAPEQLTDQELLLSTISVCQETLWRLGQRVVNISVSQRFAARKMIVRRKARFFAVRKEIYNRYKEKQQTEQQAASVSLKRVMSECELVPTWIEAVLEKV